MLKPNTLANGADTGSGRKENHSLGQKTRATSEVEGSQNTPHHHQTSLLSNQNDQVRRSQSIHNKHY